MTTDITSYNTLINDLHALVDASRDAAYKAVNSVMLDMYWNIGKRIVEEEQKGDQRAEYGKKLLKQLSDDLTANYGRGFSDRSLRYYRKFYLMFPEGSEVKRARYHSSMLDSGMLKKGQDFSEIRDSYVIFIYKHDKFHEDLPVYHLSRFVEETGKKVNDGSNIIYVNGTYAGNDDLGKLLADFQQPDASKINFKELADGVRYFKEEGGRVDMCEAVEKYAKSYAEKATLNAEVSLILNIMEKNDFSLNKALDFSGIEGKERSLITEEVKKCQKAIS